MTDELNQVQEVNDENLFDDVLEDTPEETTEEATTNEVKEETETPQVENKPFLKIRYNKEDKELNENEARELAQKGMNYDRIYDPLQRLARMNGMEVGEFLNSLNEVQHQAELSKELHSLQEKYPDTSEEVLKELAEKNVNENTSRIENEIISKANEQANAQQTEIQKQIGKFIQEYPNVDTDKIDPKVFDIVKQGYTLLEAYQKWERMEYEKNRPALEQQEKISQMNEANKVKSIGSTTNAGGDEGEIDDFFKGLNSI